MINKGYGRLLDIESLQAYLSMGAKTADKLALEAGAKRRYGRRVLYDRELIDSHINMM